MKIKAYYFETKEKADIFISVINNYPKFPLIGSGSTPMTKWVEEATKHKNGGFYISEIPTKLLDFAEVPESDREVINSLHDGIIEADENDILEEIL